MGIIYVVSAESEIQTWTACSTHYIQSPVDVSNNVVELATLIHIWNLTNSLAEHSNQNGLDAFENYKTFAKSFIANGEMDVCPNGEYKVCIGRVIKFSSANSKRLKKIHDIDEVFIEDIYKALFAFFKSVALNEKFIQSVEVGNEQYALAVSFFNEKLNQGQEYKTEWLTELDEIIG